MRGRNHSNGVPRKRPIDRNRARTSNHDWDCQRQREQMILESLALLIPEPVNEESHVDVHHQHRNDHIHRDSECRDARQETENQSEAAKKLRANREKRKHRRNMHLRGEESHCAGKAVAPEPSEDFLRAVREEHDTEHNSHERQTGIVRSSEQLLEHDHLFVGKTALEPLVRLGFTRFRAPCKLKESRELRAGRKGTSGPPFYELSREGIRVQLTAPATPSDQRNSLILKSLHCDRTNGRCCLGEKTREQLISRCWVLSLGSIQAMSHNVRGRSRRPTSGEEAEDRGIIMKATFAGKSKAYVLMLLTGLLILVAPQARADEEGDPPSRVARISYLDGNVSFQPSGTEDWSAAAKNRPVTVGDKLWTDQDSRAELQAGQASMHLGSMTALSFLNLDENITQVRIAEGAVNFRVREMCEGDLYEIDTPNAAFTVKEAGAFRVDVNENGDGTRITVIRGEGEVTAGGKTYEVRAGEQAELNGVDEPEYRTSSAPAPD